MASTIHHISIGQLYYEKHLTHYNDEQRKMFLLGTIAPDWSSETTKNLNLRKQSHFIDYMSDDDNLNLKTSIPNIELFYSKYSQNIDNPFVLGYLIHLLTDKFWFEVVVPIFIRKNIFQISKSAQKLEDLTNEQFIKWYRNNLYDDFDIHNIIIGAMVFGEKVEFPNFLEFNLDDASYIDEIDNKLLKKFLIYNYDRLKFIKTITDEEAMDLFLKKKEKIKVADLPTTTEFINKCLEYCYDEINKQ